MSTTKTTFRDKNGDEYSCERHEEPDFDRLYAVVASKNEASGWEYDESFEKDLTNEQAVLVEFCKLRRARALRVSGDGGEIASALYDDLRYTMSKHALVEIREMFSSPAYCELLYYVFCDSEMSRSARASCGKNGPVVFFVFPSYLHLLMWGKGYHDPSESAVVARLHDLATARRMLEGADNEGLNSALNACEGRAIATCVCVSVEAKGGFVTIYGAAYSGTEDAESRKRRLERFGSACDLKFARNRAFGAASCDVCGATLVTLSKCTGCREAYYCSKACQEADWKTHKEKCAANGTK